MARGKRGCRVSGVQVEELNIGASPGVIVAPVPTNMQLAIWVPPAPAVRVVTSQIISQTPLVTEAICTTGVVVTRTEPPIRMSIVRLAGVAGVL